MRGFRSLPGLFEAPFGRLLLPMLASACVGTTAPNDVPPPNWDRMTVFYPMGLVVHGRGGAGAISPGVNQLPATCLYVIAHPSNQEPTIVPVARDGSFEFAVPASAADVLELAAFDSEPGVSCSDSNQSSTRGTPLFVEVPVAPSRLFAPEFRCCHAFENDPRGGVCVRPQADEGSMCSDAPGACFSAAGSNSCGPPDDSLFMIDRYACQERQDCGHLSFQTISLSADTFSVSRPESSGPVRIIGRGEAEENRSAGSGLGLPPLSLVRVENRGQPTDDRSVAPIRKYEITDERGHLELEIPGRGDDELVVRIFSLDGLRSPEQAIYVPDAELAEAEITGVYAYRTLYPGQPPPGLSPGKIAVRISLFGADGRGLCPDSETSEREPGPSLCFSANTPEDGFKGGLDFQALQPLEATIGNLANEPGLLSPSVPSLPELPYVKFVDGDTSAPAQTIALIVDNSTVAITKDRGQDRFLAAELLINSLRSRDRMSIWVVDETDETDPDPCRLLDRTRTKPPKDVRCLIAPTNAKSELLSILNDVAFAPTSLRERTGVDPRPLEVILEAVTRFEKEGVANGKVFFLSFANAENPSDEIFSLFDDITRIAMPDPERAHPGYPIIILSNGELNPLDDGFGKLQDIGQFTGGIFQHVRDSRSMTPAAGRLIGHLAGAFVLLYDLQLPEALAADVGKVLDLTLRGTVVIDGIPRGLAPFRAPLPFGDPPN